MTNVVEALREKSIFFNPGLVRKKGKAQTLIEMIVVIGIFIILASIVYTKLSGNDSARFAKADTEAKSLANGCLYYEQFSVAGELPDDLGQLISGLTEEQTIDGIAKNNIISKEDQNNKWTTDPSTIVDPWNNPYTYDKDNRVITCTVQSGSKKGTVIKRGF